MSTDFGAPNPENSNLVRSEKKLSTASVDIARVLYDLLDDSVKRERAIEY